MPYPVPDGTFQPRTSCLVTVFVEDDVEFQVEAMNKGVLLSLQTKDGPRSRPTSLFFSHMGQVERLTKTLVAFQEAR